MTEHLLHCHITNEPFVIAALRERVKIRFIKIQILRTYLITVPTHNKQIFLRPKEVCLLWEKCLFWEVEDFVSQV